MAQEEFDLKKYYVKIPAKIRFDKTISEGAKLLWGDLALICSWFEACWYPDEYFAEQYGIRRETISRRMKELESAGYITRSMSVHPQTMIKSRKIIVANIKFCEVEKIEPDDENHSSVIEESQVCDKNVTALSSNTNNLNTTERNIYNINSKKIQDDKRKVKHKFGDFNQRQYSSDFLADLEKRMCDSG